MSTIADYFFTKFLFPFEAVSILLLIAVIGAVVLTRTVAKPTSVHDLPLDQQPRIPPLNRMRMTRTPPATAQGPLNMDFANAITAIGLNHFLVLGLVMFGIGILGVFLRRNALITLMSIGSCSTPAT